MNPEESEDQAVDYLLNPDYDNEEFLEQGERAAMMLQFMGYKGVETYCKLILDVDRSENLLTKWGLDWKINDIWNEPVGSEYYDSEQVKRKFNSFSDEEKLNIEGYLKEMATIFEGLTSEDMDDSFYHEKYESGRYEDGWAPSYFRHENREGIYRNGAETVKIGLRSLGEIDTPSARKFLVDYFNDESRNCLRSKYEVRVNPDRSNGCPLLGFPSHRLCSLEALGNRVPYSQIRATINQFLDESLSNENMSNGIMLRIGIAKFLSSYGRDPDGLFHRLLEDDDTYVRSQTRMYLKLMGGEVDTQSILDDMRLDTGPDRVINMMQYLELEGDPKVNIIRQCITELVNKDDLESLKEFLEEEEIPFKKVDQRTVDEWVQLLEGRILMTEDDPDLVITINPREFQEDNA